MKVLLTVAETGRLKVWYETIVEPRTECTSDRPVDYAVCGSYGNLAKRRTRLIPGIDRSDHPQEFFTILWPDNVGNSDSQDGSAPNDRRGHCHCLNTQFHDDYPRPSG